MEEIKYEKLCLKCGKTKPFNEMVKCKGKITSRCLNCVSEYGRKKYKKKLNSNEIHPWAKESTRLAGLHLNTTKGVKKYLKQMESVGVLGNDYKKMSKKMNDLFNEEFYKTIHLINCKLDDKERMAINKYIGVLFETADKIRDCTRFPRAEKVGTGDLPKLGEALFEIITKFPKLED